ncbi:hypothetical protein [Chryseobacterium indoltheticum]|uniref:Uncharacterized protein n=1 Tax=Chryseobacterium indoltheticum TaxID=254 RepID=A0A3G6N335_9FLAO|nr:hypothetical protein [Chryseobacterium indoltheticum]AZA62390.1 hypothetical protein EG340_15725 [Chryseobacterium indoltheticum]
MKKILIVFVMLIFGFLFPQKKYYIIFDNAKDEIIYSKNKKNIEGFNICINNKKYIKFLPSDIKSDYTSNNITNQNIVSRILLNQTVKEDNQNKKNKYIIIIKNRNIYKHYFVDHIFRTIRD